jgi:hypothetical protein
MPRNDRSGLLPRPLRELISHGRKVVRLVREIRSLQLRQLSSKMYDDESCSVESVMEAVQAGAPSLQSCP